MKKAKILLLAVMVCLSILLMAACGAGEKKEEYFNAKVLGIDENYYLVEPFADEEILTSADCITFSGQVVSADGMPELKAGDEIRIVWDGQIMETYPVQLGTVYAVYKLADLEALETPEEKETSK